MNKRDISFGDDTTVFRPNQHPASFAVIELSTRAVKLLIGDNDKVRKNGFSFDYFFRTSDLTNTGKLLNKDNYFDIKLFDKYVTGSICKMVNIAKDKNADVLYCVATAAYRSASNREEIIDHIKKVCGINVKVLSKKEEANTTLSAFMFSGQKYIKSSDDEIILIDQGGGSTEISLFNHKELLRTSSLDVGTTMLQNIFLKDHNSSKSPGEAFKETDSIINNTLKAFYSEFRQGGMAKPCIGVGGAITAATNRLGNKSQHGTRLTYTDLINKIAELEAFFVQRYKSIHEIDEIMLTSEDKGLTEKLLIMRLGLPLYAEVIKKHKIDQIIVSGTGLWYGVYYQKVKELG